MRFNAVLLVASTWRSGARSSNAGHMHSRSGEVLEVVEIQQRSGSLEPVGHRVEHGLARLANAEYVADCARHEIDVGDRGEPDEVHRPVECGASRDLEREPALASAARPADRDQPCAPDLEHVLDTGEGVVSADEPVV